MEAAAGAGHQTDTSEAGVHDHELAWVRVLNATRGSRANGSHIALCATERARLSVDVGPAQPAAPAPPSSAPARAKATAALYRHRSRGGLAAM